MCVGTRKRPALPALPAGSKKSPKRSSCVCASTASGLNGTQKVGTWVGRPLGARKAHHPRALVQYLSTFLQPQILNISSTGISCVNTKLIRPVVLLSGFHFSPASWKSGLYQTRRWGKSGEPHKARLISTRFYTCCILRGPLKGLLWIDLAAFLMVFSSIHAGLRLKVP